MSALLTAVGAFVLAAPVGFLAVYALFRLSTSERDMRENGGVDLGYIVLCGLVGLMAGAVAFGFTLASGL